MTKSVSRTGEQTWASAIARAGCSARAGVSIAVALAACGRDEVRSPRVIVSNENDGTISIIDARTQAVTSTIAVGQRPRGIRVGADGMLYVALSGSPKAGPGVDETTLPPPNRSADGIGVVDLAAQRLVGKIASGTDPEAFDLAGDRLVVSNEDAGQASIVDLATFTIVTRLPAGGEPEGVTTAPDGTVWVTSEADHAITAIDPVRGVVLGTVATGLRPRSIAFSPDDGRGIVTNEMDASVTIFDAVARTPLATIAIPPSNGRPARPMGVAIAPYGDVAYVTTGRGGSVAVVDLVANVVVRVIDDVGQRPWGIAVAPDGLLYTANGPSNEVAVIDPALGAVVQRIRSGGSPWGVAIAP